MSINYHELRKQVLADGAQKTAAHLQENLKSKALLPTDFSIRKLYESLVVGQDGQPCGQYIVEQCFDPSSSRSLLEAGTGINSSAFANITGQIIFTTLMDAYQSEDYVLSRLVPVRPTKFSGEKIPGVGNLGSQGDTEDVHEGMEFPSIGLSEDYIETPATKKRGFIVPVTKEAIFFDQTGLVLDMARKAGENLGYDKEERLVDLLIGTTNNYKWKGTSYNTYQTSTPWVNVKSSNELVDWTDIDASEQLFANMLDPNTSRPIIMSPKTLIVCPAYRHAAARIVSATSVAHVDNTAGANTVRTFAPNPLTGYSVETSALMYRRIIAAGTAEANAKKWWFHGDFSKAFAYMENWPIKVEQAATNSEAEFNRDIAIQFKASERGAAAVVQPRAIVKNYDS